MNFIVTKSGTRIGIPFRKPEDITAEQKRQGMRIASLRIFINAFTAGFLGLGAKFLGAMTGDDGGTQQKTTQAASSQRASSFEVGRADWHKWSDWERSLDDGSPGRHHVLGRRSQPVAAAPYQHEVVAPGDNLSEQWVRTIQETSPDHQISRIYSNAVSQELNSFDHEIGADYNIRYAQNSDRLKHGF